jgi:hypothetical protein
MKCLISILCLCFLGVMPAFCADFYVSTAGNDQNPGTQAQPFATIQHAVNISPSGPTSYIHLDASTWIETISILDKDISIAGDYNGPHGMGGRDVTHINGGIQSHGTSGNIPALIVSNLSAQWVDHVMQQSGSAPTSSVTNCDISNPAGDGIYGWYINANSCIVHNCSGGGILLTRGNASNCSVYSNGGIGIGIASTGYSGNVTNNTVYNNGNDGIAGNWFPVSVTGNNCHDNAGNGIAIGLGCVPYYYSDISNNQCCNNGSSGIRISYYQAIAYLYMTENDIAGNGGAGIEFAASSMSDIIISDNNITDNNGYGIQLNGGPFKIENNIINSNNSYGVFLTNSSQPDLGGGAQGSPGNNTISGNGTYEIYNASPNNIYAKNNHWDSQSEGEMAGGYYNTVNVTRIWDKWEDSSKGYIMWSDPNPTKANAPSIGMLKAAFYPASNSVKKVKGR